MSKRKHKKYKLSKIEFVNKICPKCNICASVNPEFCYDHAYMSNPQKFLGTTLYRMKDCADVINSCCGNLLTDVDLTAELLDEAFCATNVCGFYKGEGCSFRVGCHMQLKQQLESIGNSGKNSVLFNMPAKKGKKNKIFSIAPTKKYQKEKVEVRNPTPAFFCRANNTDEVDRLLDRYNSRKQDKDKERTNCTDGYSY